MLGPPQLPPHLTVTLYLSRSGSKARGEVDTALKRRGAVSAQKALQGCETEIREFLEGTEEKKTLPPEGVIGLPSRKIHLLQKGEKKWVSGQTWRLSGGAPVPFPRQDALRQHESPQGDYRTLDRPLQHRQVVQQAWSRTKHRWAQPSNEQHNAKLFSNDLLFGEEMLCKMMLFCLILHLISMEIVISKFRPGGMDSEHPLWYSVVEPLKIPGLYPDAMRLP